jgi:WD40 repeat protein
MIRLWRLPDLAPAGELPGHDDDIHALAFSPRGRTIASGAGDGVVRLFDAASRETVGELDAGGNISSLAFHPRGRYLTAARAGGDVLIWDLKRQQLHRRLPTVYDGRQELGI